MQSLKLDLKEADVKRAVTDYLEVMQAQGRLVYFRLNAGDFIDTRVKEGHIASRRRIKGAGKGTADLMVIQPGEVHLEYLGKKQGPAVPMAFVTFIECKSSKGKTTKEQDEFAEKAHKMNCQYHVVRSADELIEVLKRE